MLTLISLIFGSLFLYFSWGTVGLCFILSSLVSMSLLQQNFSSSMNMYFSLNYFSVLMIFLSCILCLLALVSTPYEKVASSYSVCLLVLCGVLSLAFSMSNIILFYIFFEASLIPTLMLIIGWGYQPERLQAGSYMMLYTVGASLPLLVVLIWWCVENGSMSILMLKNMGFSFPIFLTVVIYGAFLVKLPMYSFHLWLPKAHVEAPLAGSMILAGILLKLGGYGIFVMNNSFCMSPNSVSLIIISLSMWGGFLATMMCLRQVDVKALVAYSSVGHMSIVSSGLILDQTWGVTSALITMLAHGASSSALFCLAYFSYTKSHTRNIPYMKGMLQMYPILSFAWFVFCCINMAAPPTLNLVGELLVSSVLWNYSYLLAVVMGLMVFFSASYNMYLYSSINHGFHSNYLTSGTELKSFEKLSLFLHLMPLLLLFKGTLFIL
uniref:NADH dehydrogenase subunit 4 n=1 Tax=Aplysia argus TaxID=2810296 RepID=UPI002028FA8D|nr:NADH dehydrogenase subunit 4 [Aplysia argus]UPX89356.1 NADH dehydrogenase subunit 4 [Aplysia argus]